MKRYLTMTLGSAVLLGLAFSSVHAATINVTADITTDTLWTSDNEYFLTDVIFVRNGATLTIEPGTVVRGEPATSGLTCIGDGGSCSTNADCEDAPTCFLAPHNPCTSNANCPAVGDYCDNLNNPPPGPGGTIDPHCALTGLPCQVNADCTQPGDFCRADICSNNTDPGALVIARGSKLDALGTYLKPIVFTDLDDDNLFANSEPNIAGSYDTKDDSLSIEGNWGGVILLGNGYVASNSAAGPNPARTVQIEGLNVEGLCNASPSTRCAKNSDCGGGDVCNATLGLYGGCSAGINGLTLDECDDDDSGTLEYVSIRYGGFNLAANNEINGLTLGGVGRETGFDYIEVFQNQDDGIEFFGGASQLKHVLVFGPGDDSFDYDEGWRGKLQFVTAVQGIPGNEKSDKGGEHDGATGGDAGQPLAIPTIYNATYIGHGGNNPTDPNFVDPTKAYTDQAKNTNIHLRDGAGGRYYNSFFADWGGSAMILENGAAVFPAIGPNTPGQRATTAYTPGTGNCSVTTTQACGTGLPACPGGQVCVLHYREPDSDFQLEFQDNTFYCFGNGNTVPVTQAAAEAAGGDLGATGYDPGVFTNAALDNSYIPCNGTSPIRLYERIAEIGTLPNPVDLMDLRPKAGSVLLTTNRPAPNDGFFSAASYRGAFSPQWNWAFGWTNTSHQGYFVGTEDNLDPAYRVSVATDITVDTTWTSDNWYELTDVIFVRNGATLRIDPGTVVRGQPATSGLTCIGDGGSCTTNADCEDAPTCFLPPHAACTSNANCPAVGDYCDNLNNPPPGPGGTIDPHCALTGLPCQVNADCTQPGDFCRADICSNNTDPGALVVARGAKLVAVGSYRWPIVFTDLNDDSVGYSLGKASGSYDTKDDSLSIEGNWGGVILLGNGYVASNSAAGPNPARTVQIEGLNVEGLCNASPTTRCAKNSDCGGGDVCNATLGLYGGCSQGINGLTLDECDDDDSGTLGYVSIRYGGFNLAANNEINGLTLGGVGRETGFDYIEVFQNQDDGIEFFGGASQLKHVLVFAPGDDSFDYDEGWRGKLQFVTAVQGIAGNEKSDKGGEHDGATGGDAGQPLAIPTIYNATYIGHGGNNPTDPNFVDPTKAYTDQAKNTNIHLRDGAGGRYYNSFFADWGGSAMILENGAAVFPAIGPNTPGQRATTAYTTGRGNCSATTGQACGTGLPACPGGEVCVLHYREPASAFQLEFQDNTFYCFGNGNTVPVTQAAAEAAGGDLGATGYDPGVFTNAALDNSYIACNGTSPIELYERITEIGTLPNPVDLMDLRPKAGSVLRTTNRPAPSDGFFEPAPFRGAYLDDVWSDGWTNNSHQGYLDSCDENNAATGTGPTPYEVPCTPGSGDCMVFSSKTRLEWEAPPRVGTGGAQRYDVERSTSVSTFAGSTLIEQDEADRHAIDTEIPATPGTLFVYLVRAVNYCGEGPLHHSYPGGAPIPE